MDKKKILVIFGGVTTEYNVSLQSASAILKNMDRDKYEPLMLGISRAGEWLYYEGPISAIEEDRWQKEPACCRACLSPERSEKELVLLKKGNYETLPIDAVFPVLHGKNGEDGTMQGLIQMAGIPLIGCKLVSSAVCMDKDLAHALAYRAGIQVPRSFIIEKKGDVSRAKAEARALGYPLYVKPIAGGSSYGITKVKSKKDFWPAVEEAFRYDDRVLVEENIDGFEVGCSVMGDPVDEHPLITGVIDEIETEDGFFDFDEKYYRRNSAIHVPARIPGETKEKIKETAMAIYRALGCSGFARVDMFLTPEGHVVFNEVNTIPGFTAKSRFPAMLTAAGLSFTDIISAAIDISLGGKPKEEVIM